MWWLLAAELLYERAFSCIIIVPTGQRQAEEALEADEKANDFAQVHLLLLASQRPQQSQAIKLSSQKHELLRMLPAQRGNFLCSTFLWVSPALLMADSFWGWYMTCLKVMFSVCCWTHQETGRKFTFLRSVLFFSGYVHWCNVWLIRTLLTSDLIFVRQRTWGWMHSEWLIKTLILTHISKVLWITVVSTVKAIYLTYVVLWKVIMFSIKA